MVNNFIETCSTIYHTASGDIEIPDEMQATAKSHIAPLWLVFPNHIINTHRISCIRRDEKNILITTTSEDMRIPVSDVDKTWKALQHVFANGVSND